MYCALWICFSLVLSGVLASSEYTVKSSTTSTGDEKSKRQTSGEFLMAPYVFRLSDHQQYERTPAAVVEEHEEEPPETAATNRIQFSSEEYRPGQVISINARELLLQPDRKAPSYDEPLNLQHNYSPQRALIARPIGSSDGEASVGAAFTVSDSEPAQIDPDLLALLDHTSRPYYPSKAKTPGYLPKATTKKPILKRQKPPLPQQYLIETTQPQLQAQRQQVRYFTAAPPKDQDSALKIVASPSLTTRIQRPTYRVAGPEARATRPEARVRYDDRARYASSEERPVAYLRYQNQQPAQAQIVAEQYYIRPVYRPSANGRYELAHLQIGSIDGNRNPEQTKQVESRYVQIQPTRNHYEMSLEAAKQYEQAKDSRYVQIPKHHMRDHYAQSLESHNQPTEPTSAIYVNKHTPKKVQTVSIEQNGNSLEEQRQRLPPPKNNRAYTPEEFAALIAAGYSVTPIPVAPLESIRRVSIEPNREQERTARVTLQQFTKEDAIQEPVRRVTVIPESDHRRARINLSQVPRDSANSQPLNTVTITPELLRKAGISPEAFRRAGLGIRHLPFRGDDAP